MSQLEALKDYFKAHQSLTQLEAFNALGICRLSERVRELEKAGYKFLHERVKVASRHGAAHVTKYQMEK